MKKIISIFAVLSILASMLAVSVSAAEADIQFSVTDAKGKPGDTVKVDVVVDKNIGTWGMYFFIQYDNRYFDLVSVDNGEVYTDSEAELESVLDDSGEYAYYAESSGFDNNKKTGVLVTLEFKVLKAAPNGEHKVKLDFSDRPNLENPALSYRPGGFFFDAADPSNERTVDVTKLGTITVAGSTAESLPDTEAPETNAPETDKGNADTSKDEPVDSTTVKLPADSDKEEPEDTKAPEVNVNTYETEMVTEIVTDEEGEVVTDKEGDPVVTQVPIAIPVAPSTKNEQTDGTTVQEPQTEIVYVTDAEGEQVTEADGEPVTEIVAVEDDGEKAPMNTVVLVVCIVAAAIAIALIVVVVVSGRKNKEN